MASDKPLMLAVCQSWLIVDASMPHAHALTGRPLSSLDWNPVASARGPIRALAEALGFQALHYSSDKRLLLAG